MKILHLITCLNKGGAESALFFLVTRDKCNTHEIISMMGDNDYKATLTMYGIPVHCLNLSRGKLSLSSLLKLYQLIHTIQPDVVQTWMDHANLVGGIVARMAGCPVVWGLRHTRIDSGISKLSTRFTYKICAYLSNLVPKKIISCSEKGVQSHIEQGYASKKMIAVSNGYDLRLSVPDDPSGAQLRTEWNVPENCLVLGMVARWHPQKDYANLIHALSLFSARSQHEWRGIFVGSGMEVSNIELVDLLVRYGVRDKVTLLGQRNDIPSIMNALDINVLSSRGGEAFPNVVAEAMVCGTPCIVTNVGDAAVIVGSTGWVVPPRDAQQLAEALHVAIVEMNNKEAWRKRKKACRKRIEENFNIEKMVNAYNAVWESIV